MRTNGPFLRSLRVFLSEMSVWLWSSSSSIRSRIRIGQRITPLARSFYVRFLSRNLRRLDTTAESRVEGLLDHICVVDVPRNRDHLLFLLSAAARGTKFVVYLYDIIPAKEREEWSSDLQP